MIPFALSHLNSDMDMNVLEVGNIDAAHVKSEEM